MKTYYAHGKLLLSGEYAVLDGALGWAVPTRLGQILQVKYKNETQCPTLKWEAFLSDESQWFEVEFDLRTFEILVCSNEKLATTLQQIFQQICILNPEFFNAIHQNVECITHLEFPKDWGLGSSSTLIALLAEWTAVDAFELNQKTFQTSGYDVACAQTDHPILYQIKAGKRTIKTVDFLPEFIDSLFFVHLNQKQDTQISVRQHYRGLPKNEVWIEEISDLTTKMFSAKSLEEFESCIDQHENLIAAQLKFSKVKDLYFPDYPGEVKSLGAWGGDFVLLTARPDFKKYLKEKGFEIVLSWQELVF